MTFTHGLATDNYGPAKFIVSAQVYEGTHTTIGAALTSASSGDTIFIRPGSYTENLTLKAGVNLVAYTGDQSTPNVTIIGKATLTTAGTVSISNIRLQTNSDFLLAVTGSAASILNLNNCYLNCTNSTGISFTSANTSAQINLNNCLGDLGTTGIKIFDQSSTGTMKWLYTDFNNSGASTTASTISAGILILIKVFIMSPITTSSTSALLGSYYAIDTSAQNVNSITINGTGASSGILCLFRSGSASSISVGIGAIYALAMSSIDSSNTNAVTGLGTFNNLLNSYNSSQGINVTTITWSGYRGIPFSTSPSIGTIGEQVRSAIASGSAISLSNNTPANVTSISLTAGIWDVSAIGAFGGVPTGFAQTNTTISTTSATLGTGGDNNVQSTLAPTVSGTTTNSLPAFRISLSSTTTVYLVALGVFSGGTLTAYGRISATRVS